MKTLCNSITLLRSQSENMFYLPNEKISFVFGLDQKSNQMTLSLHEKGHWSFTARKSTSHWPNQGS